LSISKFREFSAENQKAGEKSKGKLQKAKGKNESH
jgi:hypothetical protein